MWYSWRVLWRTPWDSYYDLAFDIEGDLKSCIMYYGILFWTCMTKAKSYCHHEGCFNHFQGLLYYTDMWALCYTIEAYRIIRLGVRIKKCGDNTNTTILSNCSSMWELSNVHVFVWQKSRPGSRHFKCLNITTPLSNPEHAGFHSPKCIQRASHNSNETKAVDYIWPTCLYSEQRAACWLCRQYDQYIV